MVLVYGLCGITTLRVLQFATTHGLVMRSTQMLRPLCPSTVRLDTDPDVQLGTALLA
jgi:hypothetical protein